MREANWDEIFQKRAPESPLAEERLNSFLPWEEWLTFAITALVFMSVVASIDSAHWVKDMPSLYPIGFSALVMGYALSHVRRNELLLHPIALLAGASLVLLQLVAVVPGGSPAIRIDHIVDRMYVWWSAVTQNGISTDTLPFIVLLFTLTWLGTYVSSWAIFRWRNPWLGLIPGGSALMWNISFIPGQFSPAFVVFVFGAVLLIMRLHLARKEREWESGGIVYPEFISLSVLNVTLWVTVGLLLLAWVLPLAERSESANQRWRDLYTPYTRRLEPLARGFISVSAKKPITIHNLKDALAFQGKISLSGKDAVQIDVKITPEVAAFLRSQSFDQYTADGWKVNVDSDIPLSAGAPLQTPPDAAIDPTTRAQITVHVKVEGGNNGTLFSLGQPLQADTDAQAQAVADPSDVSSLKPQGHLSNGDEYAVTGSVNVASLDQLRAAGTDYPSWVTDRYLALPDTLPGRVRRKAREVTRGAGASPYDQAAAIESYLRTFPNDYNIPTTPSGRDTVDYFLFDLQRGYFDYHASAMTVMLRSIGIPARVATGYVVDPLRRSGDSNTFNLTEQDAFAWPEVYFPTIGWVEFSPTPTEPLINRPGTPPAAARANTRGTEDPSEPGIDLGINPPAPIAPPKAAASDSGASRWPLYATLAGLFALAVAAAAFGRFAWERNLGGASRPVQLWEKTMRLASLGKRGPQPSETPAEFATRLRRDVPGTDAAGYLAARYERSRFGKKQLTDEETERIESAWASVRGALLRHALRLRPRSAE
jgi:transglutaminase-like putative cysteine protease